MTFQVRDRCLAMPIKENTKYPVFNTKLYNTIKHLLHYARQQNIYKIIKHCCLYKTLHESLGFPLWELFMMIKMFLFRKKWRILINIS